MCAEPFAHVGMRAELEEKRQWGCALEEQKCSLFAGLSVAHHGLLTVSTDGAAGLAACTLEKSLNFNSGVEAVPEHFKGI